MFTSKLEVPLFDFPVNSGKGGHCVKKSWFGIVRSRMVNLSRKKLDMLATRYPDFTGQYCIQKDNDVTCKNGEVRKLVDVIRVYR